MATTKVYGLALEHLIAGDIQIGVHTIKCALMEVGYTPAQDLDESWDDISTYEASGTGYTAGGVELTTISPTYDSGTNTLSIACDDPAWTGLTLDNPVRYAVFYRENTTGATSWLLAYSDFGSNQDVTGGNASVVIPATGLLTLQVD